MEDLEELYDDLQAAHPETGDDLVDSMWLPTIFPARKIVAHLYRDATGVRIERWKEVSVLGQGNFGRVCCQERVGSEPKQYRAVKEVLEKTQQSLGTDPKSVKRKMQEVFHMAKISKRSRYIPTLFGWYRDDDLICFAMEYAAHGNLASCLHEIGFADRGLPEEDARQISKQLVAAVSDLHRLKVIHRDLKPENIFVYERPPKPWRVMVGDLGVLKSYIHTIPNTEITMSCSAPEQLMIGKHAEEDRYTYAVDLFSLGYVVHFLLCGCYPVNSYKELYTHHVKDIPLPIQRLSEAGVSDIAIRFVAELIKLRPHNRMNASQARNHEWLKQSQTTTTIPHAVEISSVQAVKLKSTPDNSPSTTLHAMHEQVFESDDVTDEPSVDVGSSLQNLDTTDENEDHLDVLKSVDEFSTSVEDNVEPGASVIPDRTDIQQIEPESPSTSLENSEPVPTQAEQAQQAQSSISLPSHPSTRRRESSSKENNSNHQPIRAEQRNFSHKSKPLTPDEKQVVQPIHNSPNYKHNLSINQPSMPQSNTSGKPYQGQYSAELTNRPVTQYHYDLDEPETAEDEFRRILQNYTQPQTMQPLINAGGADPPSITYTESRHEAAQRHRLVESNDFDIIYDYFRPRAPSPAPPRKPNPLSYQPAYHADSTAPPARIETPLHLRPSYIASLNQPPSSTTGSPEQVNDQPYSAAGISTQEGERHQSEPRQSKNVHWKKSPPEVIAHMEVAMKNPPTYNKSTLMDRMRVVAKDAFRSAKGKQRRD